METMAFVLHSGGLDSSTVLLLARTHGPVTAVSIEYGQRHETELDYAAWFCEYFNIPHQVVGLGWSPPSMLTDASIKVPDISYDEIKGMSPTYVPFRNGQLLSRVAGLAQSWVMAKPDDREATVWFGAHAEDALGFAYPDCTSEFVGAMAAAIYVGTYHKVRLMAPFTLMTKSEIVKVGVDLTAPYERTWSCYKGESLHCGICPTCRARKAAFVKAEVTDPTEYAA